MVDSYVSGRQQKCLVNGELSWHTVVLPFDGEWR